MEVSSNELRGYLSPDESVRRETSGTLVHDSYRSEGAICVTDRRVVFVSNDGGFLDFAFDVVYSIQSRPRTTFTYRAVGYRLLAAVGVLTALTGAIATVLQGTRVVAAVLLLLTVGGAAAAEYVRRSGIAIAWTPPAEASGMGRLAPGAFHLIRPNGGRAQSDDDVLLILGLGLVSLTAIVGLVVLTDGLLVVLLSLVTLGGLALSDRAYRRTRTLEEAGGGRRHEREVSVHLVDGSVVYFRVDPACSIDRDLSVAARTNQVKSSGRRAGRAAP